MGSIDSAEKEMELIAYLYNFMDDQEKASWSRQDAEEMVNDQRLYEINMGAAPRDYDANDFYEVIAEFIAQDAQE